MKRILIALLALSSLLVTAAPAAAASERAAALRRDLGSGVKVAQHRGTGVVRFVGAAAGKRIARPSGVSASAPPADAARAFLGQHADAFGLRNQARELRVESARGGSRPSVRFQQVEGGVPVIAGELVANLDAQRNLLSVSGETLPDANVDTSPRLSSSAARDTATAAIAKGEGVSGARLDAGIPELAIYDARLLGGPGPNGPTLVWQVEVKGQRRADDRPAGVRRRPDRQRRAPHQPDRERQEPLGLRRQQQPRLGQRRLPVHRRRLRRHRGRSARRRRRRRRRARVRVRRRHLRLLLHALRPRQPRRRGPAAEVDRRLLRPRRPVPAAERVLERPADGLRRRLRLGGRRGRPRAHPRRHRVQLAPLLLLPVGRDQRVAVRRVRRVRRPDQRRRQRHRAASKWQLGEDLELDRRHPQHEEPAGLRRPRPDDQPELHDRPRRGRRRAASTPTAASTTRPRT